MQLTFSNRARRRAAILAGLLVVVAALIASGTSTPGAQATARIVSARQAEAKISSQLHDQLVANPQGKTRYLVMLSEQPDVENNIVDWIAKGRFVYERLRQTADATQPPVAALLDTQTKAGNVESFKSYYIINAFQVRGNLAAAEALAALPGVDKIDVFPVITIDPPVARAEAPSAPNAVEWNVSLVHAPQAWALGYNGAGITVGSLDTGTRYTHKAIVNKYRGNLGGGLFDHNYNWWDPVGGAAAPHDENGHGTHTMGTILGDDGLGNQVGVAPGANWISSNGIADGAADADIIEAGEFMIAPWNLNRLNPDPDKRPHVVSDSWGYDVSVPFPGCSAVEFFHAVVQAWRAAGIFPSFSAGNDFPQGNRPPAAYPETFETGALRNPATFGGVLVKASYSSEGPSCYDGGQHPQIMAGGGDQGVNDEDFVRSSYNTGDTDYEFLAGTSMAQPATAGAVAILKQVNPNLSISQTWFILTSTASFDLTWNQCGPRPNICYGWGMLQIDAAVQAARGTVGTSTPTVTGTPPTSTVTRTPTRTATATATRPTATATRTPVCVISQQSEDVPQPIIDLLTTNSTLTIANGPVIAGLDVISVTIDHSFPGDLDVFLVSPAGTRVELFTDVCADVDWTDETTGFNLSDHAGLLIGDVCPPQQATYKPEGHLSAFIGESSTGTWTLEVTDDEALVTGSLDGWGLRIGGSSNCPAGATPSPTSTRTRTTVPVAGTATRTATRTGTPRPATATQTGTPRPATSTRTGTTVPSTATRTVTRTVTRTATLGPATNTPRPATATATRTSLVPTAPVPSITPPVISPTRTNTRQPTITPRSTRTPARTSTPGNTSTPGGVTRTPTRTATPCSENFNDVGSTDYFYQGVVYLTCVGAISGYNDGSFRPYNNATRAQLVKIVVITEGFALLNPQRPTFTDVPTDFPFYRYIETAVARGIIDGYDDGTFRPYNNVTRGQICKIVVTAEDWDLVDPVSPTFNDTPPGSPFYFYVETAHSHGIIDGYNDGTFRWFNFATRGQIAKIVHLAVTEP